MTRPLLKKLDEGKLYYSISEVCQMTGLEPHVLRYWETEFRQIKPKKNRAGNRAYRIKEIKYIRYLRYLLHEEKFTLQGAKKKISEASLDDVEGQLSLLPTAPARVEPDAAAGEAHSASESKLAELETSLAKARNEADRWKKILGELHRQLQSLGLSLGSASTGTHPEPASLAAAGDEAEATSSGDPGASANALTFPGAGENG